MPLFSVFVFIHMVNNNTTIAEFFFKFMFQIHTLIHKPPLLCTNTRTYTHLK
uniref:Uncharacterized protein n=1 Tax=Anguilla anguilla TaxID=7936 RepID=A0A0E9W4G3_ANGAN